jgi:hypothetical protein
LNWKAYKRGIQCHLNMGEITQAVTLCECGLEHCSLNPELIEERHKLKGIEEAVLTAEKRFEKKDYEGVLLCLQSENVIDYCSKMHLLSLLGLGRVDEVEIF